MWKEEEGDDDEQEAVAQRRLGAWISGGTLSRRPPENTLQVDESSADVCALVPTPLFPPENPSVSDETPGSGGRRTSHPNKYVLYF